MQQRQPRPPRLSTSSWTPFWLFAALFLIVFLLLGLTYGALALNKGIRGYSAGESLWSKSRKEAVHQLDRYLIDGDLARWERYRQALQIPLADRRARLEMDRKDFDFEATVDHFVDGANHPEDVPMMIRLYRWFIWHPKFARVIETWVQADQDIIRLSALGGAIRETSEAGDMTPLKKTEFESQLARIDQQLARLETAFSSRLGEAARLMQSTLTTVLLSSSLILLALGGYIVRYTTARIFAARTFEAEERFRKTFEVAPVGIFRVNLDGTWADVNESMCRILGYPRSSLVGACETDFLVPGQAAGGGIETALREKAPEFAEERRYRRIDGENIVVQLSGTLVRDIAGQPLNYVAVAHDITESRRLEQELSYRARHDALTGLYNRYEFESQVKAATQRSANVGIPCVIALLDLDRFKVINDTCGHAAGDAMLTRLGSVIRACLRKEDTLARLGGDEFGILLERCPVERAHAIAKKIRSEVSAFRFSWEGKSFSLGISIGLVPFAGPDHDAARLLSVADMACYRAKESGRNQISISRVGDISIRRHQDEMRWLQRNQDAYAENRFELVWQPIVKAGHKSGELPRSFEVLLRMRGTNGSMISPGSFLPVAERYGQIIKLDHWVLTTLLDWLDKNTGLTENIDHIHINVSGAALSDPDYISCAKSLIAETRFPVDRLCFELTETMAISNISAALAFMNELGRLGCRFALDDFGIGVSSFAYLNSLPCDYVKIDGVFVRDIDSDPVHEAIVTCINDVVHSMGKETVAEFVENEAVRAQLNQIGCDHIQGYAVGRAVSIGDFELLPQFDLDEASATA